MTIKGEFMFLLFPKPNCPKYPCPQTYKWWLDDKNKVCSPPHLISIILNVHYNIQIKVYVCSNSFNIYNNNHINIKFIYNLFIYKYIIKT